MSLVQSTRAKKAKIFWSISQAWHGIPGVSSYSVQDAMDLLNEVLAAVPDGSKLATHAYDLKLSIIKHGTKEHKQRVEARTKSNPK